MRNRRKSMGKIVSLLLAVAMIVTSVPQSALTVSAAGASGAVETAADGGKETLDASAAEDSATPENAADEQEENAAGNAADEQEGNAPGNAADNPEGEALAEGAPSDGAAEGNKPADVTGEDEEPRGGQETPDDTEGEEGTEQAPDIEDADREEDLAGDEPSLDEEEEKSVQFCFWGERDKLTVYDITNGDNTDTVIEENGFSLPYGSKDSFTFKVVPKSGYIIVAPFLDSYFLKFVNIECIEEGGVYTCKVRPKDEEAGYVDFGNVNFSIKAIEKASYKVTFKYASEDVEELALTNGTDNVDTKLSSNTTIMIDNEYDTSFKLKMKDGKVPAVSYEDYNGYVYSWDYEKVSEGYYFYNLGKLNSSMELTIQEGWEVSFEYNDDEIDYLTICTLDGDEEDLPYDAYWDWGPEIGKSAVAVKGEPFYFTVARLDEYYMCSISVTDKSGAECKYLSDGEGGKIYKVTQGTPMPIKIELISKTLPVTYEEGVVKNLNITADDERVSYDAASKEITNIYNFETEYNISFEIEEGKAFGSADLVYDYSWYDEGEYVEEYYYESINVEKGEDGVYSSVDPFVISERTCIGLRIIAGDAYTVTFKPEGDVKLYEPYKGGSKNIKELDESTPKTIVNGGECSFFIALNMEKYELAVPYVTAKAEEKTRELEAARRGSEGIYDEETGEYIQYITYYCSIAPTADTEISVSIKPEYIPFRYTQGALKDIDIAGGAVLSEDGNSIDYNNWDEINNCEISFTLEENKIYSHAYVGYTAYGFKEGSWEIDRNKKETCTRALNMSYDDEAKRYTIRGIGDLDRDTLVSLDYIQIVAGDACEITFNVPDGIKDHVSIIDFNNYEDKGNINTDTLSVETVMDAEYLFRIELSGAYNAASLSVTAGDKDEELPVRYYTMPGSYEWETPIAYYGFTPTGAVSTLKVNVTPQTIPIKYTDDAVEVLSLVDVEAENAPSLSEDKKSVDIWSYDMPLEFELQLASGKKLSRIYSRHFNGDEYGNKADGFYENDIQPNITESGSYQFRVDLWDITQIEIVTDKVNLADCKVELELEKDTEGNYYANYQAGDIKPAVTVTYDEDGEGAGAPVTLDKDDYIVTYENNRDVSVWWLDPENPDVKPIGNPAVVTVRAKDDSGCTGSRSVAFNIVKADAPVVAPFNISVDVNDTRDSRELNLTKLVAIDTPLGEKGITAIEYTVDTADSAYTKGGVLADDPRIERNLENKDYNLVYDVAADADENSAKAVVVLNASFENYKDAKIVINISMAAKTLLRFAEYQYKSSKTYDGLPFEYDLSNLYLVDDDGKKLAESDAIMAELEGSIKFRYSWYEWVEAEQKQYHYDSYETPINVGSYNVTVELSEENANYMAEPYAAQDIRINQREIRIRAEDASVKVGAPLPESYSYSITGDGLLDGDRMDPLPTLSCDAENTDTVGQYTINVDADDVDILNSEGNSVKKNYYIRTSTAKLTVTETQMDNKAEAPQATIKVNGGEAVSAISKTVDKGDDVTIILTADETDYTIYYTDDGKDPSSSSKEYPKSGISINNIEKNTIIKAVTVKGGKQNSEVATITITVNTGSEKPDEPKDSVEIKLEDCEVVVPSIIRKKAADPIKPETYVTYKGYRFIAGLDYSVSEPAGPDEDGFYTVTLTGLGRDNDGRIEETYQIAATSTRVEKFKVVAQPAKGDTSVVDISKAKLSLDASAKNAVYTGSAIEPKLDFSKDKTGLEAKIKDRINYAYKNNINAGKATVTISVEPAPADSTDTTVYAGSKTFTFNIKKAALNKNQAKATAKVVCEKPDDLNYKGNGKGIELKRCEVTVGSEPNVVTLCKDIDYTVTYKNNAKAGKATVTIKGIGNNVSGSFTDTYTVAALDLSKLTIDAADQTMYYSPKGAKLGTIIATNGEQSYTLKEGTDFTAKYTYDDKKAKAAGSGVSVKISGKNGCSGKNIDIQGKINILPADFAQCINVSPDVVLDKTIADKNDENKTKAALAKALAVTDTSGAKLKLGKGYKMTLGTDADTGNTVVDIEPAEENSNYEKDSKKTVTYRVAANLAKDKNFVINKTKEKAKPLEYDGRNPVQITQSVIDEYISNNYKLGENIEIVPGTYKNNTKKGTAQVKVQGIGNLYGTKVLKFKVVEK